MEAPLAGGHAGALPIQGQGGRREWRKVNDMANGRERLVSDVPGNQARSNHSARPRSGNVGQRRSSQNGRMFHPGSSDHSSDSDHHGGDGAGGHLMGGPVSPQDLMNQNIGQEDALYDEMHRQQQNEHASMSAISLESGMGAMENADDALEQRLHDISRQREQLQQAELELRSQFIARSEVHRIQNNFEEQSKQHADVVASLQNQIRDRDQRIHHLEQNLEEREQQHRANQMQANEAVWAKDGLLREQTNEIATLRRECEAAVAEQKAAAAQLDAERSDFMTQLEHLKEQLHEKERHVQEAEEQNRAAQDMLLFKDGQLQDAQAWMARAQELDNYHVNANNTLHAELRDRSDQLNQLWMGYQRQLQDMERFHATVVQRLQAELSEAREQPQILKGSTTGRLLPREERHLHTGNDMDLQREGNEGAGGLGLKTAPTKDIGAVQGNPIIMSHMESGMPVFVPLDSSTKGEQTTGLPVVPTPVVTVMSSGGIPVLQQYSLQHHSLPSVSQPSPNTVLQTSTPAQMHVHPPILTPQQNLPPVQQRVVHAHHQSAQSPQVPDHSLQLALPPHNMQPSHQHQLQILEHEVGQQHGGIILSQLSSGPISSVQSSTQKGKQEVPVAEPVQPPHEEQQRVGHPIQHHRQSSAQQERQRQEQQQHSQTHKQLPVQQHDETLQLQHQQGISSTMHHLSQPAPAGTEDSGQQHKPLSSLNSVKQELMNPVASPVNPQPIAPEPIKVSEPVLLDEKALLGCLIRAIPAESTAKIRISSTLPNRLGKMLAPLHWHDYKKQYGRLDEFVNSHKELFVIDGDYIHLREGAHAMVSATTAVAKAAAAAAAAGPVGPDRLPTVAVTPVAQVSQVQRGKNVKSFNKDERSRTQLQQDDLSSQKQRTVSPQRPKSGSLRQHSGSFMARSHASGVSTPNNGSKMDSPNNMTGGDHASNGLLSGNSSAGSDSGEANSYGNPRGSGYHGNRQQSRNSVTGSGQYRKQENHYRSHAQENRSSSTPSQ